jgi:hypothetical protein
MECLRANSNSLLKLNNKNPYLFKKFHAQESSQVFLLAGKQLRCFTHEQS